MIHEQLPPTISPCLLFTISLSASPTSFPPLPLFESLTFLWTQLSSNWKLGFQVHEFLNISFFISTLEDLCFPPFFFKNSPIVGFSLSRGSWKLTKILSQARSPLMKPFFSAFSFSPFFLFFSVLLLSDTLSSSLGKVSHEFPSRDCVSFLAYPFPSLSQVMSFVFTIALQGKKGLKLN